MTFNKLLLFLLPIVIFSFLFANTAESHITSEKFYFNQLKSHDHTTNNNLTNLKDNLFLLSTPKEQKYKKGELIVKFKKEVEINPLTKTAHISSLSFSSLSISTQNNLNSLNTVNKNVKSMKILFKKQKEEQNNPLSNIHILQTDQNADIYELAKQYGENPLVEYAEPNYLVYALETPNDPNYTAQWGLEKINISEAYDIEKGDSNIIIAILDTGVDWNHTELSSRIWDNGDETEDGNDTDGNGYIDDMRGWDYVNNDNNPTDDHGHGTHCSGIAAADTNNSVGISGVCWNCTIMPVKCLDAGGGGSYSDVALAIEYAANNSAHIISMSLGSSSDSNLVKDAVNYAYSQGIVVIAAAGNNYDDTLHYPAAYDNAIAVTATTTSDSKSSFSTYGYWTDIAAPGSDIYSTLPNNQYASWDGTSMATPFVAGLAGLLLSKNNSLNPDMLETIIKSTSDNVSSGNYIGIGRINAYNALLKADSTTIAKLNDSLKGQTFGGDITINGTANGTSFANYTILYGSGIYPENWTIISTYATAVSNSNLTIWNTNGLSNGIYTIILEVNDIHDATFIDYAIVSLDNIPPQITISSPLNQTYPTPTVLFKVSLDVTGSWCGYSVDGEPNTSMTYSSSYWSHSNTDISNGQHNVTFHCNDSYGNMNSTSARWFSVSAKTVSNCSVLNTPNSTYYLVSDITNSSDNTCINITAQNITLNCQNHLINGINTAGSSGIYTDQFNTSLANCHTTNWNYGIYSDNSNNSTIQTSLADSNNYGIYLTSSSGNRLVYNEIKNSSSYGIYLSNGGINGANDIYNNLFNNTNNTGFGGSSYSNNWNTTSASGNRIYSTGNNIGGNYYTNSTSNGYSDTCTDADEDGFCDSTYSLNTSNIDYLPLSDKCKTLYCINCSDCNSKIQSAQTGTTIFLNESISNQDENCILINKSSITFDCQNHFIDGDNDYYGYGIYVNSANYGTITNITIQHCHIKEFGYGIYFYGSSVNKTENSSIIHVNSSYNKEYGLFLSYGNNNTISNTTVNDNYWWDGILLQMSSYNTIQNITANRNGDDGISFGMGSRNNTFQNMLVNYNYYGIYSYNSSYNSLQNITANYNHYDGFLIVLSNNTNFENITANYNDDCGMDFGFSLNNTLNRITTNDNDYGIHIYSGSNQTTLGNTTSNNNEYGIYIHSSSHNNIGNITANNNTYGIRMYSGSHNTFENTTANNNSYGIYLYQSYYNSFQNATLYENNYYDFYISTTQETHCNNILENITGSGGRPIEYYNYSANVQNKILSELILCNANNSNITNITIIGSRTKKNNGILIQKTGNANLSWVNSSYNYYGISITSGDNNSLHNITANYNCQDGIYLGSSSNNILEGITANYNNNRGIFIELGSANNISNITSNNNSCGFLLLSSNNTIQNAKSIANNCYVLLSYDSYNNMFIDSILNQSTIADILINAYSGSNRTINNTFINTTFRKDNVTFQNCDDGGDICQINVKWYLDVFVNYPNGTPANHSNVSCYDKNNNFMFSNLTNSNGTIPQHTLLEYIQTKDSTTYSTPYVLNATKSNAKNITRQTSLTQNTIVYLTLNSIPKIALSYNNPNNSFIYFNYYVNETWANATFCTINITNNGTTEQTDTLMLTDFSTTDNYAYTLLNKKYENFSNGNYTLNATCYDTLGNSNNTHKNFTINDTIIPILAVGATPSTTGVDLDITANEKVNCTLRLNNNIYSAALFSKTQTFEVGGLSSSLEYDYNLSCIDINNNIAYDIDSFITTNAASSGGDDDDTGDTTPITPSSVNATNDLAGVTHFWDKIEVNKQNVFSVSSTKIPIRKITFYLKNAKSNVKITVKTIKNPTNTSAINKKYKVKSYVEIDKTNFENTDINNITLEIKLAKSEIPDKTKIYLLHYMNPYWMKVVPYKIDTEGSYYIFHAKITRFSYFAIVEEDKSTVVVPEEDEKPEEEVKTTDVSPVVDNADKKEEETTDEDEIFPGDIDEEKDQKNFLLFLIPILFVVLILSAGGFYFILNGKENEKEEVKKEDENKSFFEKLDSVLDDTSSNLSASTNKRIMHELNKPGELNLREENEENHKDSTEWNQLHKKHLREHHDIVEEK